MATSSDQNVAPPTIVCTVVKSRPRDPRQVRTALRRVLSSLNYEFDDDGSSGDHEAYCERMRAILINLHHAVTQCEACGGVESAGGWHECAACDGARFCGGCVRLASTGRALAILRPAGSQLYLCERCDADRLAPAQSFGILLVTVWGGDYAAMCVEDELGEDRVCELALQGRIPYTDPAREINISTSVRRFYTAADRNSAMELAEHFRAEFLDYDDSKHRNIFMRALDEHELAQYDAIVEWKKDPDDRPVCANMNEGCTEVAGSCPRCSEGLCRGCLAPGALRLLTGRPDKVSNTCAECADCVCRLCMFVCPVCEREGAGFTYCGECICGDGPDDPVERYRCRRHKT